MRGFEAGAALADLPFDVSWAVMYATSVTFFTVVVPIVMVFVVPRNRHPGSAIAWLFVIALVPVGGLVAYWLLGTPRLPRQRRARRKQLDAIVREAVEAAHERVRAPHEVMAKPPPARLAPLSRLVERLGGLPAAPGNHVDVVTGYHDSFQRMAADIDAAEDYVHVQFYILVRDDETEVVWLALERAAARGVDVRVLLDHLGSRSAPGHLRMKRAMTHAGIQWARMLPVLPLRGRLARPDLRNHRKIIVVDGRVAWAGSQNLIARDYHSPENKRRGLLYQELMARMTGMVVSQLDVVFRSDWFAETGELLEIDHDGPDDLVPTGEAWCQVLPSGPAHPFENNLRLFNALLYAAERRVVLVTPYFVPDESLVHAMTTAAQRGVEVDLVTNAAGNHPMLDHAQHSYYEHLVKAGVHVYRHQGPEMLHVKTMSVDDDLAVIGSSNLDMRSFHLNFEVTMMVHDLAVVREMRAAEMHYRSGCVEWTLEDCHRRPLSLQVMDSLARLTATLQ